MAESQSTERAQAGLSLTFCLRCLRWFFWAFVYFCRRKPQSLDAWLVRIERCHKPWWKFRPSLYHNEDGRMWQIFFKDERCLFERALLQVEIGRSVVDGEIVAMNVWDEILRPAAPSPVQQQKED